MKDPSGQKILRSLARSSDVLLDPFRPGVMERLNCGPERIANERLIFARLSGFGQTGPMRDVAGHDINYLAQSGVLDSLRDSTGKPCPPINLVADFAGGGVMMALGVTSAIIERGNTGKGQVLDLAMSEGAAYASGFLWSMKSLFPGEKGTNMLDGGAPFYGLVIHPCDESSNFYQRLRNERWPIHGLGGNRTAILSSFSREKRACGA